MPFNEFPFKRIDVGVRSEGSSAEELRRVKWTMMRCKMARGNWHVAHTPSGEIGPTEDSFLP